MTELVVSAEERAFLDEEASHWGKWRATSPIYIDGVRALNPGADVPNGLVETYHLAEQGLVEEIGTEHDADESAEESAAPPQGEPIQGNATVIGQADDDDSISDELPRKQK
jgi:hypothetical protein